MIFALLCCHKCQNGGEDLWDGACEDTGFVVDEVCEALGIYSCIYLIDGVAFDKVTKVGCAYVFLMYAYVFNYMKLYRFGHIFQWAWVGRADKYGIFIDTGVCGYGCNQSKIY